MKLRSGLRKTKPMLALLVGCLAVLTVTAVNPATFNEEDKPAKKERVKEKQKQHSHRLTTHRSRSILMHGSVICML